MGKSQKNVYSGKILESPTAKIKFGNKFPDSCKNLDKDRIKQINEQIDKLAKFAEAKDKKANNPNSLDLKEIKGQNINHSTHEFDAWSDKDAKRIYCHYEGDTIVLDKLGKHL